jgi:hypothetical protein
MGTTMDRNGTAENRMCTGIATRDSCTGIRTIPTSITATTEISGVA